jgi:hypothetical protein
VASLLFIKMITQLNPTIPLTTPKGKGFAHLVIDYSQEHDLLWVVFLDDGGECWTFKNSEIKIVKNFSLGRDYE